MYKQVELNYSSDALEPVIDQLTVETHYGKHHATYTKTLNELVQKAGVADMDIEELLGSLDKIGDETLRQAIRNNGGGYYNHNLYFSTISGTASHAPTGILAEKIDKTFGSLEDLKKELTALALGQFGSGWAWLSADKDGNLFTSKSPNQDNPISEGTGRIPILAIDVWEHAYYLKYKNLRPEYVKNLFEIIDWKAVEKIYQRVTG